MGKFDYAKCSNCGKVAHDRQEVDEIFDIRNNDYNLMVQSWCRKCR